MSMTRLIDTKLADVEIATSFLLKSALVLKLYLFRNIKLRAVLVLFPPLLLFKHFFKNTFTTFILNFRFPTHFKLELLKTLSFHINYDTFQYKNALSQLLGLRTIKVLPATVVNNYIEGLIKKSCFI